MPPATLASRLLLASLLLIKAPEIMPPAIGSARFNCAPAPIAYDLVIFADASGIYRYNAGEWQRLDEWGVRDLLRRVSNFCPRELDS